MIGLDRVLERARPFVSSALADGAAWRGVAGVAAQLPASLSSSIYLEAPLGDLGRAPRLDLIVRVDRAARAIISRDIRPSLEPIPPRGPLWSRVRSLARRWESDPILDRCGEAMWLEFDIDPTAGAAPGAAQPGVFFDFSASAYRGSSCAERREMIAAALAPLAPLAPARTLRRSMMTLERCLAALPREAGPASIGILLPREASTVRLCILGLGPRTLETYLQDIAWPGSHDALGKLRATLDASDDRHAPQLSLLHLDLAGAVLPRAGIEYRFDRAAQRRGELAERAFCDRLVRAGLCDAPMRDAMIAWPGVSIDTMPHELWPSVSARRVNHVKVMCDETRAPYAKGYLCIRRSADCHFHEVERSLRAAPTGK